MIPNKELQDLARALKNSAEYGEMLKLRKKVLDNAALSGRMMAYEKEQRRIFNSGTDPQAVSEQIKRLNAGYGEFLNQSDVRTYVNAVNVYQKMIDSCFTALDKALDVQGGGGRY
jgi:cell fate (sporulation/competence/biofilm development) regulator YlbF (YheA/YmcA/DUF963 family)